MTTLLTDNLPLLASAPNGIKKLRELILELAVRGKLVPQDSSDEPANELLRRIAEEKMRLVAEGKIKKQKPLTEIDQKHRPFEVPTNWEWVRVAAVGHDWGQKTPDQAFTYIDVGAVDNAAGTISTPQVLMAEDAPSRARKVVRSGTVIYSTIRPYLLNVAVIDKEYEQEPIVSTAFAIIHPYLEMPARYFLCYLRSPVFVRYVESVQIGIAYPAINDGQFFSGLIPLPPLAEQHRIVAKVDELMALCDRLEAQHADADSAHTQLVQALLDSISQSSNATEFAANWQRLAEHFHALFTTEPSIDALKQTLLQLAVMGKLTQQDPSDEPPGKSLRQIAEKKARLLAEGTIKKQPSLGIAVEEKKPFAVPEAWEWCRVSDLISIKHGYAFSSAYFCDSASPYVLTTPGNFHEKGGFRDRGSRTKYYRGPVDKEFALEAGDLIVAMTEQAAGLLGSPAIVPNDGKVYLHNQRLGKIIFDSEIVFSRYIFHYFNTAYLRTCVAESSTGMKVKHTSPGKIGAVFFPIPPLAEQHRIAAKVDQLMDLCDELKTRLIQARQLNEKLASTMVEHALDDDGKLAPAITDQKAARTLLAAEVTHRLHAQRTFGQRKLQKVVYLAEHAARLDAIQATYLRNVAGPHDRQLMNQVEAELQKHQWYGRIDRETVGHAYRPLSQAGQHREAYKRTWSAIEQANIEQVIELMRDWDTDRCEMTVTLYAAWNDFIIEGRQATDDDIVDEVMHRWNEAKLRFSKREWLAVLAEMKKHRLLTPTGFGKRTSGGTLNLPGFE
ncbi:restriction endonuclease subunit S [Pseudomonas sp. R1-18]|uniref:restriction endonuclease subunit S n=1 Tax=Pseudomonas sp. R1-18 TaxID=1632772 RepID=UPI003DA891FE